MKCKRITPLLAMLLCLAFSLPALAATPVDINSADAATIAANLDGVGMVKARAIVDYRKAHGPFKQASDLTHVKGIGKSTLAHNKDAIQLDGPRTAGTDKAAGDDAS